MLDKVRFLATISVVDTTDEKGILGKLKLLRDIVPSINI